MPETVCVCVNRSLPRPPGGGVFTIPTPKSRHFLCISTDVLSLSLSLSAVRDPPYSIRARGSPVREQVFAPPCPQGC